MLQVLPGAETGGVQRHVADLAAGLARRGVDVTVAVGSDGPLCDTLARARIGCVVTPMRSRRDRARAVRALHTTQRAVHATIVHTHGPLAGLFGREAAARDGLPFVHTMHGRGVPDELARARTLLHRLQLAQYRWTERRWHARSAALIAVSASTAHALVRDGDAPRDRLVTIPNGIDVAAFADGVDRRASFGWSPGTPVVATIGRLAEQKDPLAFVACAARVARAHPNARFLVIGEGPLRAAVECAINAEGLRAVCVCLGERTDVADLLATCAIVVCLSRYEGLPLTVLEAFAARRPVVATDVDGLRDVIVDGDTGRLVPPGDARAAADAVDALLRDPHTAQGLASRAHAVVRERYTRDRMVDDTLAVYRRVCADGA